MRKLTVAMMVLLMCAVCTAESVWLYYPYASGEGITRVKSEAENTDVSVLVSALTRAQFGENVSAVLPEGAKAVYVSLANGIATVDIKADEAISALEAECVCRTLTENTPAKQVILRLNGRFICTYPENAVVFLPDITGEYVVPVVKKSENGTEALMKALSEAADGLSKGIPTDSADIEAVLGFDADGRRVMSLDFPMDVFTSLEETGERRWQFLASVSLTALNNIEAVDIVRISFDGQLVTAVPGKDGLLMRFENGDICFGDFAGFTGTLVGDTVIGSADSMNPRAVLSALGLVNADEVVSWKINGNTIRLDLSRTFFERNKDLSEDDERSAVYGIVNAICEYTGAKKVRITLEGADVTTLSGRIRTDGWLMPIY